MVSLILIPFLSGTYAQIWKRGMHIDKLLAAYFVPCFWLGMGGLDQTLGLKVRNHLGVNNTLEPHPWQKPDLTDPSGRDALYGFGVYSSGLGTQSDLTLTGFLSIKKKKKKKSYN